MGRKHTPRLLKEKIVVKKNLKKLLLFSSHSSEVQSMSRFTGLQFTGLPCLPVFFFRATPSPRFTGGMPVYRGGSFFHARGAPPAAAHSHTCICTQHNTTQHAGCCGKQPTLAYTPCPCAAGELCQLSDSTTTPEFSCYGQVEKYSSSRCCTA